ncbi:MAG: hypothetical protein H6558_22250 [Lewinellaceae bacterium]|nr:hypothetical protein [Lewinellaceae bacterium]
MAAIYERCFIHDSYATRKGKGTHAAVVQAQRYLRREGWFLKTDIDKYFDSIRHSILLDLIERKIKDASLLGITERIVCNGGLYGCRQRERTVQPFILHAARRHQIPSWRLPLSSFGEKRGLPSLPSPEIYVGLLYATTAKGWHIWP